MPIRTQLGQYARRKATKRLYRALPIIGSVVAIATLGLAMRRKGALRGLADTALDFIPFVGGVKALAEVRRGRDFFPDKPNRGRALPGG
jgi:hypothetical protein